MKFGGEMFKFEKKLESKTKIEIESGCDVFVPEEFRLNPLNYFETKGKNIKSGEVKYNLFGKIKEDPTAVKEFPVWSDKDGNELRTIGKKINIEKGKVGESGDPFYEYKIMEIVKGIGLPTPSPIAKVEHNGIHLIVMEKALGDNWYELKDKRYTNEEVENLKLQGEEKMNELKNQFEEAGIIRGWKLKDMVFDIDNESKIIKKIIPVDWERTKIDEVKLAKYREGLNS